MISLAIKYLKFHGYLVVSPEEQADKAEEFIEHYCPDCGEEIDPFEQAYQAGFFDGRQVGN